MIGHEGLEKFYHYPDQDTGFNQLLGLIKSRDAAFIQSLDKAVKLEACSPEETNYLTKAASLIDYALQKEGLPVPHWLRDDRLVFSRPYYHSRRLTDFDRVRLLYTNPGPFRARNVYFDLEGLGRI